MTFAEVPPCRAGAHGTGRVAGFRAEASVREAGDTVRGRWCSAGRGAVIEVKTSVPAESDEVFRAQISARRARGPRCDAGRWRTIADRAFDPVERAEASGVAMHRRRTSRAKA